MSRAGNSTLLHIIYVWCQSKWFCGLFVFSNHLYFFILFLCVYLNLFLSLACVFAVHSLAYMRNNCADLEKLKTFTNFGNKNEEHFKVKIIKIIKLKIMINKSGFESSSFAGLVVVHVFFPFFFSIRFRYFSCTKDMNINVMLSVTCI